MEQDRNNQPLVSIITPLYNAEKYIAETIESVLNQTYKNWEMIIVDDCSQDESISIVNEYVRKDRRIKLLKNIKNRGVSATRNKAIRNVSPQSKYIAFLDSDDLWKSNKLEKQIYFMEKNNYSFTFSDYEIIDKTGQSSKEIYYKDNFVNYSKALKGNPFACLTVVLETRLSINVEFSNEKHEDYIYWLDILEKNSINAYNLPMLLGKYRKTDESLSSNKVKAAIWTWKIYKSRINVIKSIYYMCFYIVKSLKKHM